VTWSEDKTPSSAARGFDMIDFEARGRDLHDVGLPMAQRTNALLAATTSIIPPLTAPAGPATVTATMQVDTDLTVASGQTLYSTGISRLLGNSGFSNPQPNLVNNGTLWATYSSVQLLAAMNFGKVFNNGIMVAQSTGGSASALTVGSSFAGLTNTGALYAIAHGGTALAEQDYAGSGVNIVNSGTIAAQSDKAAYAIDRANGGSVVNAASGSILAEGTDAVAVFLGRGHQTPPGFPEMPDVQNAGLIQAVSTDPATASVAIYVTHIEGERLDIVNSGIISGDYAIYAGDGGFSPLQLAGETVTNQASGAIHGEISLGYGDDTIVNHGLIQGYVDMGQGADSFDTGDGVFAGVADMGTGDDSFAGGTGTDLVTGGRGNDALTGGGGNDLLLGGRGDDVVQGGTGNDGLYGEAGNDRIVTQGGDRVYAGDGDDRVELGDYGFAGVDGGVGQDVLVLPGGARVLDLQQVLATGRVTGFEGLELSGNKELIVRAGDVSALSGGGSSVRIGGDGSDKIDLVGSWAAAATHIVNGVTYQSYVSGGAEVQIAQGVAVALLANAPSGGTGLDAVAAGAAPLAPGAGTGLYFAGSDVVDPHYYLIEPLQIDADEHWTSTNGSSVISGDATADSFARLTNRGTIVSNGGLGGAAALIGFFASLRNDGTVQANVVSGTANLASNKNALATYGIFNSVYTLQGNAIAIEIPGNGPDQLVNTGTISANTDQTIATGILNYGMPSLLNQGNITAHSDYLAAVGVFAHNGGNLTNSGSISATGAVAAYGIGTATFGGVMNNSGTISAQATDAGGTAIGIYYYYQSGLNTLNNSGTISATTAIQTEYNVNGGALFLHNSGHIDGDIALNLHSVVPSLAEDAVFNTGVINGAVSLGIGRDIYIGTGGQQHGLVSGGDGSDLLIGTSGADALDGGVGDDILFAAGGDTVTGGSGRDSFVYAGPVSGAVETITDFQTGVDHLDLSGLSPSSVGLSSSGGITTVTVTTAAGTLVIHATGTVAQSDIILSAPVINGTSGDDALVATAGGSTLHGNDGSDLLVGSTANDVLDGGIGGDIMWGGAGDDTYVVDSGADVIWELPGGGFDTMQIANGGNYYRMPDNVERLVGGGGYGNALDNVMIGSAAADVFDGGAGNDQMTGGAGDDIYYVDSQGDVVFENSGQGNDTVHATTSFYLYANVENLILEGTGSDYGVGNAIANTITGNAGNNLLIGGGGDDLLRGNAGNDQLFGGNGADHLYGGDGIDYLVGDDGNDILEGNGGADALYGGAGDDVLYADGGPPPSAAPGEVPLDTLVGTATGGDFVTDILVGGDGNDILHGDSGRGDYDLMDGGAGSDIYYVDTPADLTFEAANGGTDTVYADINGAGYYLYANVENLVLLGSTSYGVGNQLDNHLTGNAENNYLLGGAGNDVLNGKSGNDVLFGEAGADTFVFQHGTGGDVIGDFTPGTDKIDLSEFGFATFAQVQAAMGQNGTDSFINLGGGDFIVLNGVGQTDLHASDFLLGGGATVIVPVDDSESATRQVFDMERGSHIASISALIHMDDLYI
jgi:Ca2+-binding RTX toxin-like protein